MDIIGQEHDLLQRDLNKKMNSHSLLSRIDEWERESINKIQQVAKQARIDLEKLESISESINQ
jgi:BMFP domain-containing protein YqiC